MMCLGEVDFAIGDDQGTVSHDDFRCEAVSVITSGSSMMKTAVADLGELPAGQHGLAVVRLTNPFDFDIPISSITGGVGCKNPSLRSNEIPALGVAVLQFQVSPPTRNRDSVFRATLRLAVDRTKTGVPSITTVRVALTYRIKGMLCFPDRLISVDVPDGESMPLAIPFISTLDRPLSQLQVKTSGVAEGIEGKIVASDGASSVQVVIDAGAAKFRGGHATITLADPTSGLSDSVELVIYRQQPVRISPRTLHFRQSESGLSAVAILQIVSDDDQSNPGGDRDPVSSLFCEAFVDGQELSVSTTRVSDKIYRIQVQTTSDALERAADENELRQIQWNVIAGDEKVLVQSFFAVSRSAVSEL
ncbi:hypothetical protein K227x_07630 [Rubripirellula lacrimiformis]|uniref:Uncharacterized protein n=2 Tax=Rubripirellula lacrimiformis TaxID=1930273 RepID=A0A517N5G7_9BACT|nr:hypothetical protein K227x_07630 [Rubripirellula lacrimiformis]